MTEVSY